MTTYFIVFLFSNYFLKDCLSYNRFQLFKENRNHYHAFLFQQKQNSIGYTFQKFSQLFSNIQTVVSGIENIYNDTYLTALYKDVPYNGYDDDIYLVDSPSDHIEIVSQSTTTTENSESEGKYAETLYGELLPSSLHHLIVKYLKNVNSDDVMYDLGSGTGKVVIQFACESSATKCVGIELGYKRHQSSMTALKNLKTIEQKSFHDIKSTSDISVKRGNFLNSNGPIVDNYVGRKHDKLSFIHGDLMKVNWWEDVTVLYINAFVFGEQIMSFIENKIIEVNKIRTILGNKKPVIKYVLLFGQRFSDSFITQQSYTHYMILAPQSFSDDSTCELYIHNSFLGAEDDSEIEYLFKNHTFIK